MLPAIVLITSSGFIVEVYDQKRGDDRGLVKRERTMVDRRDPF